jgi:PKD repeat protein
MKLLRLLGWIMGLFLCSFQINAQNRSNSQKVKQLPQGHQLRSAFDGLPVQAKAKAEKWLDALSMPEEDFNSIRIDDEGGIFYVDTFQTESAESGSIDISSPEAASVTATDIFTLHSKPGASKVVHLNFEGFNVTDSRWNRDKKDTFFMLPYDSDGNSASFSIQEIKDMAAIWHRVSEDYAPFDVDITTEAPPSYGPNVGHILITNITDAEGDDIYGGGGGVAYVNVWGASNFEYYQPALVFYNNLGSGNAHNIAEASSHELGHNLSLSHDGDTNGTTYYGGHGTDFIEWAPIMGVSYYRHVSQWSKGEYTDANNHQDDLLEIGNRLGYSADDHGNSTSSATVLDMEPDGTVNVTNPENDPFNTVTVNKGVIESSTDVDMFSFYTTGGQIDLTIRPSWEAHNYENNRGSNLDIKATLYNSSGNVISTYSLADDTYALISTNLGAGAYYVSVEGESSINYSEYASIGKFFISGTIEGGGNIPTNNNPVASYTSNINDRTVSFTDTSSDSDGTIVSWSWNFGDGNTSTNQNPIHNYSSDSDFTVNLTVTDDLGATHSMSQSVTTCLDSDGDGVCDDVDVCADSDDTVDADNDSIPDGCDTCPNDPNNDADDDGVCGDLDICPGGDDNADIDGDGIPDFCDTCNDLLDSDSDGLNDCFDNEINSPCPNNVDANGVSVDSDNDGVADCIDLCDGDDTADADGDGIPDACDDSVCVATSGNFGTSTLSHSGSGLSNTSITIPTDGQDITFAISSINEKSNGNPKGKYIEEVKVTYIDGGNNTQTYGIYSGASTSSVNVSIDGAVKSVTIELKDILDGNVQSGNMSISLSPVNFCVETVPCIDSDDDGVCDEDDLCPGADDNLDTDGDGIRDCQDSEINSPCPNNIDASGKSIDTDGDGVCDDLDNCPSVSNTGQEDVDGNGVGDVCESLPCFANDANFDSATLISVGAQSNSSFATINGQDVSFIISGIDQRTGGKPTNRYIEQVTVTYINDAGSQVTYGVFTGSNSVAVNITEVVQSITVSLVDGYDGNSSTQLSVNLSSIDFCVESGAGTLPQTTLSDASVDLLERALRVYPNPASNVLNFKLVKQQTFSGSASLYNFNGQLLIKQNLNKTSNKIRLNQFSEGIYMLIISDDAGLNQINKRIIINH